MNKLLKNQLFAYLSKLKFTLILLSSFFLTILVFNTFSPKALAGPEDKFYIYETGIYPQTSTDKSVLRLSNIYNVSNTKIKIKIYKISKEDLFKYIIYNSEGNQVNKFLNTDKLDLITTINQEIVGSDVNSFNLPISGSGLFYAEVSESSGYKESVIFVRSNIGITLKNGKDKTIYWVQNLENNRSMVEGTLKFYKFSGEVKKIDEKEINNKGIVESNNTDADLAVFERDNNLSLVKVSLNFLNSSERSRLNISSFKNKYFTFTDKPLYKPGDTVYFKSIIRDEDDARFTVSKGLALVKIFNQDQKVIYEKNLPMDEFGSISGEYKLPSDITSNNTFSLNISRPGDKKSDTDTTYIDVNFYRKPNYIISLDTSQREIVAGNDHTFKIKGSYFSGHPLAGQTIKYSVIHIDAYKSTTIEDVTRYPLSPLNYYLDTESSNVITKGEVNLDSNGEAQVTYKVNFDSDKNQVVQINAEVDDGSSVPSSDTLKILAYRGNFDVYLDKDYNSDPVINKSFTFPVILKKNIPNTNIDNVNLTAYISRYYYETDSNNNSSQLEDYKGTFNTKTNYNGQANINYTFDKTDSYTFKVEGFDDLGNKISNSFSFYPSETEREYTKSNNLITLTLDKEKYNRGDIAKLSINSEIKNTDLLLSIQRSRVSRYEIVSVNNGYAEVKIPLQDEDLPNIFAEVSGILDNKYLEFSKNILINTDNKKLNIQINATKDVYAPGDEVTLNISARDLTNKPAQADLSLAVIDKALYSLVDSQYLDIFNSFWYERYNNTFTRSSLENIYANPGGGGGGCFAAGTKILMQDHTFKNIEDIKTGDYVLTRESENNTSLISAKVTNTHKAKVSGYLIINGIVRVTAEHRLFINGSWKEAGYLSIGDKLLDTQGNLVNVDTIEWIKGFYDVYNFTVEKYHTYFADNIYVHNDKGIQVRGNFADTAYWNPSIRTNSEGLATVSFKIPDNLTTWVINSVGNTKESQFGTGLKEFKVSKDVVISPILPNILRQGDTLSIGAVVQNFTDQEQNFETSIKVENAGTLESPDKLTLNLKPKEIRKVSYNLKVGSPTPNAKFTYYLKSLSDEKNSDAIELSIPIIKYGFYDYRTENSEGNANFKINFSNNIDPELSNVTLGLSASVLGALPNAFEYLISYPYGCAEQTTSRLVPALLAIKNPSLFNNTTAANDSTKIINKSIQRLENLSTAGWSFWSTKNQADPFITAYVIENLLEAKNLGFKVNDSILEKANSYLEEVVTSYKNNGGIKYSPDQVAAANYALALSGKSNLIATIDYNLLLTDGLAFQVMANYLSGNTDPNQNGLNELISRKKDQGDSSYFESGSQKNFGSQDASSALALRAIILAKGDLNLALKITKFLVTNRSNNYYWSNTFGTSQVAKAVIEFSKVSNEENPNYSFKVVNDNKEILNDTIKSSLTVIPSKIFNYNDIKGGTNIEISKNGEGKLYSSLIYKEFVTDRNYPNKDNGIKITKEYINTKGDTYNIGVGDLVDVTFKISGSLSENSYALLYDELPAGMVPVNVNFKNESYAKSLNNLSILGSSRGEIFDSEYTQNGAMLTINDINKSEKVYSYRARVVAAGKFISPPTFISLMYTPNVKGNTAAEIVEIYPESSISILKVLTKFFYNYALPIIIIILIFIGLLLLIKFIMNKKGISDHQIKEILIGKFEKYKTILLNRTSSLIEKIRKFKK